MAGFRTHVGTSSALGVGYASTLHAMYGVPVPTATVAGALCGFAGMLPDLDSDYGVPLREAMSFTAATIPVLLVNRFESLQLSRDTMVIIAIGLYLFVRFGVGGMIRKFTVHRGMFHSIPAMLIFGGITYLLTGASPTNDRLLMSGGVMGGFLSHLILDEIYAVEFKGGRWRTKKSFGTALKLWGGDGRSNFAAYAKLAVVGMGVVGEPNMFKNFVANQPMLANQINQAINIASTLTKDQPQLANQVNQLKDILGTLTNNNAPQNGSNWSTANNAPQNGGNWPTANTTPQNGGGWPTTNTTPQNGSGWPSVATSQPNGQYPAAPPTAAYTNQYQSYPSPPAQQIQPQAPTNNQPSDQQWSGANQPYSGDGQAAPYQNDYDTAQRPSQQYSQ